MLVVEIKRELSNKFANMGIVAAMAIVLIHCYLIGDKGTVFWWFTEIVGGGRWLSGGFVRFAVPYFFLASGFFLAGRIDEYGWYKRAVASRMKSLVVPYFLWGGVALMPFVFIALARSHTLPSYGFLLKGLGIQWHGLPLLKQLWFLRALFILILLSPILRCFARPLGLFVIWAGYAIQALEILPVHWSWYSFFGNTVCMEGMFFFTLGIYLRRKDLTTDMLALPRKFWLVSMMCMIAFLVAYAIADYGGHIRIARLFKWLSIPFSLITIWQFIPAKEWPKSITLCSFPLYLVHYFFLMGISRFIDFSQWHASSGIMFLSLAFTWIFTILCSMLLTFALRRIIPNFASFIFGGRV